jgi:error-prone DNA polymerase
VEVLPPDIGRSEAGCSLECGADASAPRSVPERGLTPSVVDGEEGAGRGAALAVRIGLAYVQSVGELDAEALVAERDERGPYRDVGDLARRAPVSRDALEALVRGGACDGLGRRRDLLWELGLVRRPVSVEGTRGEAKQLPLALESTAQAPELPDLTRWERMLADYRETGLSVGTHPLTLLRPHLPQGILTSVTLEDAVHGSTVAFAGLAIARQRPSTAKGIVFMLLEDEHGHVNLVVPPDVYERHRGIVRSEPLLLARGRFERIERNRNILVTELESLSPLARQVAGREAVAALPRAHHFGHR